VSARRENQVTDSMVNAAGNLQHLHYASLSSTTFLDRLEGQHARRPRLSSCASAGEPGGRLAGAGGQDLCSACAWRSSWQQASNCAARSSGGAACARPGVAALARSHGVAQLP
jgi:hypothetical protein